jgi:hypothetical protein
MEDQILRPIKETLNIKGKISYSETQGWNTIRLKKEITKEFPALNDKRASFSYQIIFYRDYKELERAIRKMKREGKPIPILLYLKKDK